MSKGVKKVLGVVAAIAVPFVAPAIAGAIGLSGAVGQAAVGAGLGAAASAATGVDPIVGALTGGIGTYARAGGLDNLFGGAQPATTGATTAAAPAYQAADTLATGTQTLLPGATPAVTAGLNTASLGGTTAANLAAGGISGISGAGGLGSTLASGLRSSISALADPTTLARVTLLATMAGAGDMEGVSAAEKELVAARQKELQQIASTNQELFDLQVKAANDFMQMAAQRAANPAAAFAETKIAAERDAAEDTRGLGADEARAIRRQAAIRGTQAGAVAAAAEEASGGQRQAQLMQTGAGMLPTAAPERYAGMMMPLYEDLAERRRQAQYDAFKYAGALAPGLFSRTIS
jgi:hypothetical protein